MLIWRQDGANVDIRNHTFLASSLAVVLLLLATALLLVVLMLLLVLCNVSWAAC